MDSKSKESGSKIAIVGLTCLDIISECEQYPKEDDKIGSTTSHNRCLSQRWQRGGNASNTSTVLAILGASPTLVCTLANAPEKEFLLTDMASFGVNSTEIVFHSNCHCPLSVVICSATTGSRTIVHSNQNLPELTVEDLAKLPLGSYNWVHFEGRNVDSVVKMLKLMKERAPEVAVSVELEKPRANLELLMENADVIFASKDYAKFLGFQDMESAAKGIMKKASTSCHTVIVPWGEEGACAVTASGEIFSSPAFPPTELMDTLGAGDTFIASSIYGLSKGKNLRQCLEFGCRVAGLKVGLKGWQQLKSEVPKMEWFSQFS